MFAGDSKGRRRCTELDSVDTDDLLKKHNVYGRTGCRRSLMTETPPTEEAE